MADLAAQLHEGDTVEGVVTSLRDYGAFVSIRSPDGELHGTQVTPYLTCCAFIILLCLHEMKPCSRNWSKRCIPLAIANAMLV